MCPLLFPGVIVFALIHLFYAPLKLNPNVATCVHLNYDHTNISYKAAFFIEKQKIILYPLRIPEVNIKKKYFLSNLVSKREEFARKKKVFMITTKR